MNDTISFIKTTALDALRLYGTIFVLSMFILLFLLAADGVYRLCLLLTRLV